MRSLYFAGQREVIGNAERSTIDIPLCRVPRRSARAAASVAGYAVETNMGLRVLFLPEAAVVTFQLRYFGDLHEPQSPKCRESSAGAAIPPDHRAARVFVALPQRTRNFLHRKHATLGRAVRAPRDDLQGVLGLTSALIVCTDCISSAPDNASHRSRSIISRTTTKPSASNCASILSALFKAAGCTVTPAPAHLANAWRRDPPAADTADSAQVRVPSPTSRESQSPPAMPFQRPRAARTRTPATRPDSALAGTTPKRPKGHRR